MSRGRCRPWCWGLSAIVGTTGAVVVPALVHVSARAATYGQCWSAAGYVRDAGMRAIAGATVSVDVPSSYCGTSQTVTDGTGHYSVEIQGNSVFARTYATASAAGYESQTQLVNGGVMAAPTAGQAGAPSNNHFSLSR